MIQWENLDKLGAYKKLQSLKNSVSVKEELTGEKGAERVAKYTAPMAAGLTYNYAAKQVNEQVLSVLQELADEAQLTEKFEELFNGAIINTGENRKVLHHLVRGQLGKDVIYDNKNGDVYWTVCRIFLQQCPQGPSLTFRGFLNIIQ